MILIILITISIYYILKYNNKSHSSPPPSSPSSPPSVPHPAELFNNLEIIKSKLTENQINSGVLVHMFSLEDMENLNNEKDFTFNLQTPGTADCGGTSLKSCSAWTFLRKDIPPMLFTYPTSSSISKKTDDKLWKSIVGTDADGNAKMEMFGSQNYWTPNCAVILDAKKAWPLLTTMGIIDSGTDERNCLSNGRGDMTCILYPNDQFDPTQSKSYKPSWWPKNSDSLDSKYRPGLNKNIGVIQSSNNMGAGCSTSCNKLYKDNTIKNNLCKYRVAGGSISKANIGDYNGVLDDSIWNWDENDNRSQIYNTFNLENKFNSSTEAQMCNFNYDPNKPSSKTSFLEWKPGKDSFARNPFLCVTQKTPTDVSYINNDIEVNTFNTDPSLDVIYNYVGSNSPNGDVIQQSKKNVYKNNGYTFAEQYYGGNKRNNTPIGTAGIMNWQCKWEKKDFNRWITEIKNFWKQVLNTLDSKNLYINDSNWFGHNNLLANPNITYEYFENEVNMFINPNITDDNDKYNNIYRDSIIGFGFFNETMTEQLEQIPNLNNIRIWNYDSYYGWGKYNNIKDRIEGIKNQTGYLVGPGNSPDVIPYIYKYEKARLLRGKELMNNIKEKFNSKYHKKVSLYELNTYCPILQNYLMLKQTFNGELDGYKIFSKI